MIRLLSIVMMMFFLSVGYIDNSYAHSDHEHDKYEQEHEKHDSDRHDKYERESDHELDEHSQPASHRQDAVSQSLDAVGNGVDKTARKIKQAKEWWQFW